MMVIEEIVIYEPAVVEEIEITLLGVMIGGGGGGATIPHTTNVLKGDNAGNAADTGIVATSIVLKQPTFPTPTNVFEIIQCLQAAGLCV